MLNWSLSIRHVDWSHCRRSLREFIFVARCEHHIRASMRRSKWRTSPSTRRSNTPNHTCASSSFIRIGCIGNRSSIHIGAGWLIVLVLIFLSINVHLFLLNFSLRHIVCHLFTINHDLKARSSNFDWLTEDNLLRNSCQHILFRKYRCSKQNLRCLFVAGLPHHRNIFHTIDSIPVNRSHETPHRHPVCQHWQVPMVDIDTIGFNNFLKLVDKWLPSCFDS